MIAGVKTAIACVASSRAVPARIAAAQRTMTRYYLGVAEGSGLHSHLRLIDAVAIGDRNRPSIVWDIQDSGCLEGVPR